jgi:hypothetical protein
MADPLAWDEVAARIGGVLGEPVSGGLRCLVSYRALASLAEGIREGQPAQSEVQVVSDSLDRLMVT